MDLVEATFEASQHALPPDPDDGALDDRRHPADRARPRRRRRVARAARRRGRRRHALLDRAHVLRRAGDLRRSRAAAEGAVRRPRRRPRRPPGPRLPPDLAGRTSAQCDFRPGASPCYLDHARSAPAVRKTREGGRRARSARPLPLGGIRMHKLERELSLEWAGRARGDPGSRLTRGRGVHRPSRAARCGRSRCRPTARGSSRSTRRTTGSRSSTSARGGLTHAGSVPVGLEPVAVAARTRRRGVGGEPPLRQRQHRRRRRRARRASCARCSSATSRATSSSPGPGGNRAFITTAHRGQNTPPATIRSSPPPGVGRADVWVFDATNLGATLGGTPLTIVTLFGDTPRALAVSARRQHASTRRSSTRATGPRRVTEGVGLQRRRAAPARAPSAASTHAGRPAARRTPTSRASPAPEVGLIVKFDPATGQWQRRARPQLEQRRSRFTLPDHDVFAIDADATPPVADGGVRAASARSSSTWPSTR